MASQPSGSPRERTDKRSDVLSDATDLDALLEAILGNEDASAAVDSEPTHTVETKPAHTADAKPPLTVEARIARIVVARPAPTFPTLQQTARFPGHNFARSVDANAETWGFAEEKPHRGLKSADDNGATRQSALSLWASRLPRRPWRVIVRVLTTRQLVMVASLSAAALITVSAISLRDNQRESVAPPPSEASVPAPVPSSSPVEPSSAGRASVPAEGEVLAAASEPIAKPRVISSPSASPRPANARSEPVSAQTRRQEFTSPAAPVTASPASAALAPVAENTDRAAPATPIAAPESVPRPPVDLTSTSPAAPIATSSAEPATPTAALPAPIEDRSRTPPRLLTGGAPEYPAALRTARIGGNVEVRYTIDATGRVTNVQSVSGPPQLRLIAEAAVRRWRYAPAQFGNVAIATQTSVNISFDPSPTRRPQE